MSKDKLIYIVNSDWYFYLHWLDRAVSASNDFEIHVIAPLTHEKYIRIFDSNNIIFHSINMSRSGMSLIKELYSVLQIYRLLKKINPSLIHTVTIKPNVYGGLISRLLSIPLVSTFAGLGVLSTSTRLKHRKTFQILGRLIKLRSEKNDYLALFENQEDLDLLVKSKVIPIEKTMRVYGAGVDINKYVSEPLSVTNNYIILFAARLLKDKGLDLLIEARERLLLKGFNVDLQVAGIFDEASPTGYTRSEIEKLSNDRKITWLGQRDDIPDLISSSNVVALPTTYGEGVPRILIEAASCSRPIVATEIGGCKDICINGKNGLTCKPNDIESLVNALESILVNAELATVYGNEGRKLVETYFTSHAIITQNNKIYYDLLKENE